MARSFVVCALVIAACCWSNEATAQDTPFPLDATVKKLEHAERAFRRPNVKTYPKQDSRIDGLIRGALIGVLVAVTLEKGLDEEAGFGPKEWATIVAISTGTGYAVDAMHSNREPIRRPGAEPMARGVKLKLRF